MIGPGPVGGPPAGDAHEEDRYRAVHAFDPADPQQGEALLRLLSDASWRVRAAASERIASHPRPAEVLPALLEVATAGGSAGARNAAAAALAGLGAAAVGALLPRLAAERPEERCIAADVLGEIGDRRAALALGDLLADGNANVRASAAEALGKVGGAYAVDALLGALSSDDTSLRVAALEALLRLGVAPPLERLAELVEDRSARASAYRVLALSGDAGALALLAGGVGEMSRGAREAAYLAIARQAATRPEALAPLADAIREASAQSPSIAAWASEAVAVSDLLVAEGAVRVLGFSGHIPSALRLAAAAEEEALRPAVASALLALGPEIANVLGDAPSRLTPPARVTVQAALARVGHRAAIPDLAAAASAAEGPVQAQAIEALGGCRDEAAVAPLARLLDHPDPEVSGLAAAALGELARGSTALRDAVLAWCRPGAEGRTPAALLRLLGEVGAEGDVEVARRALRDPRPATRVAAVQALGALAARAVAGTLPAEVLEALDDPQPRVRAAAGAAVAAAATLGSPGAADVQRALGTALRDEVPAVRAAAARAAGAWRVERLAGTLAALVDAPEPDVASSALRALAEMGKADAAVVERAGAREEAEVAKEAMAAAVGLPEAAAHRVLLAGLVHGRWDVRRAAARGAAARRDRALEGALRDLAGVEEDPLVAEALAEALRAVGD
ncbi:MAG TPA: HEAT repeat domain-containing protein [Anaeromyxobacteraceae bacterium]|nr:HEAT repeat domain-containing protein [Anaeromyxobacteraceae bacterium]